MLTWCYTELKPEPLKLDLAFLRECTKHSSADEKAQIWRHYQSEWIKGMQTAEKQGLPDYQIQNYGRKRANSLLRERTALRKELRG